MSKCRSLQETDQDHNKGTVTVENTHPARAAKKHSSPKDKASQMGGFHYFHCERSQACSQVETSLRTPPPPVPQLHGVHGCSCFRHVYHTTSSSPSPGSSEGSLKYVMYFKVHLSELLRRGWGSSLCWNTCFRWSVPTTTGHEQWRECTNNHGSSVVLELISNVHLF